MTIQVDKRTLKQKNHLEELKDIALKKGGKCLSCIYKNNISMLEWQCKRGHRWFMKPSYVKYGTWCNVCKKINILDDMKKYAESRDGKCLSDKFTNSKTKLLWQCNSGHVWKSNSAKYNQSWCPYCAKAAFLSEAKCRFIFEKLTGYEFKTNRSVLNGLELDGYCNILRMAFEYQGQQHYKFVKYFHKTRENFYERQRRDEKKKELCNNKKIHFLAIPHWKNIDDDTLFGFIKDWVISKNISTLEWRIEYWKTFYAGFINILDSLRKMAAKKNGKLISTEYHGSLFPLKWQCQYGHKWEGSSAGIQQGHWCIKCNANNIAKRNKNTLSKVQNIAQDNNSLLIDTEYKNNITPLKWKCLICFNSWLSTLNCMKTRLLKGKWCLFCKTTRHRTKRRFK